MDILNTKIKDILTEKTLKIRPENIKSGVSILGINGNVTALNGETKTVTPTTSQQTITPSSGKNAITQVTVNAVTSAIDNNIQAGNIKNGVSILGVSGIYTGLDTSDANATAGDIVTGKTAYVDGTKLTGTYAGIIPSGTINITQNGTADVTNYASANVSVPTPSPTLQSKSVTITENGSQTITADSGYDGLSSVGVTVTVQGGSSEYNVKAGISNPVTGNTFKDFITEIKNVNIGSLTNITSFFTQYTNLKKVELFDTSNVTVMNYMFYNNQKLEDVPLFNTSKVTAMVDIFYQCNSLTDASLNNILAMAANSIVTTTANKKLSKLGLVSYAAKCRTLSNYQAFINAGWVDDL